MTFEFVGARYDIKLVLRDISIRNPEWTAQDDENNNGDIDYFDETENKFFVIKKSCVIKIHMVLCV